MRFFVKVYFYMKKLYIYICLLLPIVTYSQLGGSNTFEFVTTSFSAREHALGGAVLSLDDADVSLAIKNPSLLDSSYSGAFSTSWGGFHILQTDIGMGTFAYAHSTSKINYSAGVQFFSYGKFSGYSEDGTPSETFFAHDYQLITAASYEIYKKIYAGISLKPVLSFYESYSSFGILHDFALSYKCKENDFTTSFIVRNAGWHIKPYTSLHKEPIPFSIDFGLTKKLSHAPFRFSLLYQGLQKFDLSYTSVFDSKHTLINQPESTSRDAYMRFFKNALHHVSIGAELLLFKSLHAQFGYDFRKAYEMSYGSSNKAVGVSFGFHITLSYFSVSYAWAKQHVAGATNFFTFSTNIDNLYTQFIK